MMDISTLGETSLDQRTQPLSQSPSGSPSRINRTKGLNKKLNTDYIDFREDDKSILANTTRCMTSVVRGCCTPRSLITALRVLKALTFAFLLFTIAADLMFIIFVSLKVSDEVNVKVGGMRDTVVRIYGLALTTMAIMIELDFQQGTKHFIGFKSFIPRAFLLFFIATITASSPLHQSSDMDVSNNSNSANYSDDKYYDDKQQYDDYYNTYDDYYQNMTRTYTDKQVTNEIPSSTVIFQMVTAFTLGICGLCYLILGLFCVDRLRSKAYVSSKNLLQTTAIPNGSNMIMAAPIPEEVGGGVMA